MCVGETRDAGREIRREQLEPAESGAARGGGKRIIPPRMSYERGKTEQEREREHMCCGDDAARSKMPRTPTHVRAFIQTKGIPLFYIRHKYTSLMKERQRERERETTRGESWIDQRRGLGRADPRIARICGWCGIFLFWCFFALL